MLAESTLCSRDDHLAIAIFPCVCTKYVYATGELFLLKKEDATMSPFFSTELTEHNKLIVNNNF